jgi:tRNA (uracil-5-)-methyltransferase
MVANGVDNIFIARMSSEEFTEAWKTKASKRRLEGLGEWDALNMRTVLVDPPRSGLDDQVGVRAVFW